MNQFRTSRLLAVLALFVIFAAAGWPSAEPNLDRAQALYRQTQYRQALQILEPAQPKSAASYALAGQCYYMLGDFGKASEALEKAVAADPRNSVYWDWFGRAYGKRAENAFPLMAPSYASKARQYFEKAVELDLQNLEAVDDLFEYYLEAPGFLGGGMDKAEQIAARMGQRAPAKFYAMLARLAEKQKKPEIAEQQWRAAVDAAPNEAGRYVDLARFLARLGRYAESDAAFERARELNPNSADLKFQHARTYVDAHRNLDEARKLLQDYLNSALTPDDPPRADAEKLLKKLAQG
jgi:tetratricopeptide (TPR) repeat protein